MSIGGIHVIKNCPKKVRQYSERTPEIHPEVTILTPSSHTFS
jgi:hypothetical protein